MLKYCKDQWVKNETKLKHALMCQEDLDYCGYETLVELIVEHILNDDEKGELWDSKNIKVIDDGDYQGTILYVIPRDTYQPAEYDYLITYVGYGSCSGCDTLQRVQMMGNINDYMTLCKDLICNIIKPYNTGWRNEEIWNEL